MRYFFGIDRTYTKSLPVATETETVLDFGSIHARVLQPARFEQDSSLVLPRHKYRLFARPTEADSARPITRAENPSINYVGDPGDGNYVLGASCGPNGNTTLSSMRTHYQSRNFWPGDNKMSVIHNYSGTNAINFSHIDTAHTAGFIASETFRGTTTLANYASGAQDAQIDGWAASCIARHPKPIWLCFYHEPESKVADADLPTYRAAQRRMMLRFRAAGVANVAWFCCLMGPYTWESGARDWRKYLPDWTGSGWQDDIVMDMFGADIYDPEPTGTTNQTFSGMWNKIKHGGPNGIPGVETNGYPVWDYIQPEFGMSYHATPRPNWGTWCAAARDYAKIERIKHFSYWDNSDDIDRYCFNATGDPDGTKMTGWNTLIAASTRKVTI